LKNILNIVFEIGELERNQDFSKPYAYLIEAYFFEEEW
jgi:hypothetical protein